MSFHPRGTNGAVPIRGFRWTAGWRRRSPRWSWPSAADFLFAKGVDGKLFTPAGVAQALAYWPFFGHPRAANAPRAGEVKPDGFAIWKTRLDTSSADPLACIEMTRDLDPSKSYGDFVLVSPDLGHAPAVIVQGRQPLHRRRRLHRPPVTLLKGLPAKDGETLAANADADFTNGDKPPYVGFAGQGVILPREDSDGVGIETVNVSKLQIEVWRVVDRNLVRKSISAPDPTPEGQDAGDYGDDSPDDEGCDRLEGLRRRSRATPAATPPPSSRWARC